MTTIPEGLTSITPFIEFDDPSKALEFYKNTLGAEERLTLFTPDGELKYAEVQVGTAVLMVGSPCPMASEKPVGSKNGSSRISFYVYVNDLEEAFNKAKKGGMKEIKGIEEMFWGDRMGTLHDPFNVEWTIAQHMRDVSPEEMQEAMKTMFV
ncbi:MAG: VOC family protein [Nitrospinota bacterium]